MPARNLPHVGRKFTRESAKLERRRKKEERRRQRIDERPKQQEEIFKHEKTYLGPDATVIRRLRPDFSKPTSTPVQDWAVAPRWRRVIPISGRLQCAAAQSE
jgi:hypothetical protein